MRANKLTKVLLVTGLAFSTQVLAKSEDYKVNFTTIADVSIALTQAMDFGDDLNLASGSACSMEVNAGDGPSELDARIADAGAAAGGAFQAITGTGCNGGTGTAGIYTITGAPGVTVNISVNGTTGGAAFNFTPEAVVANYDDGTDGDNLKDLTLSGINSAGTVQLATLADETRTVGGLPVAGESRLYVGGTITTTTKLDADTDYAEDFTIDVTY
ncbi:MAG: hypothetical protein ACSHW0_02085 [Thalassotalea sp.]